MLDIASGKWVGGERHDVTDSAWGKESFGRDVMSPTVQGGKRSVGRDVILQSAKWKGVGGETRDITVQGERGRSGET